MLAGGIAREHKGFGRERLFSCPTFSSTGKADVAL
jgi:hypothetical protein